MKEVPYSGILGLGSIGRYENSFSVNGRCSFEGRSYCATFDFAPELWTTFASTLQRVFYLDTDELFGGRLAVACGIDPALPIRIDLVAMPGAATEAKQTGEEFVPLIVSRIGEVGLAPTQETLQKRHAWWSAFSKNMVDELGSAALQLREVVSPGGETRAGPLDLKELLRNLAVLRLARLALDGESKDDFVDTSIRRGWIEPEEKPRLSRCVRTLLNELSPEQVHTLRNKYANLLTWFAACRILSGAKPGSIEAVLCQNWGLQEATNLVLHEGRCCLSRTETPGLPKGRLEADIRRLARGHDGIRQILVQRTAQFLREMADHPELSPVAESYVLYDLFRQIYKARPGGPVNDEMATRCEENVRTIVEWIRLFAQIEGELFSRGLKSMSV